MSEQKKPETVQERIARQAREYIKTTRRMYKIRAACRKLVTQLEQQSGVRAPDGTWDFINGKI